MDDTRTIQDRENIYSQPLRQQSDIYRYSTGDQPHNLGLVESPRSLQFDIDRPAFSQETHSSSLISPASPSPATYLSTPPTQYYSSSTNLPQDLLDQHRTEQYIHHHHHHHTPVLRVHPAEEHSPYISSTLPPSHNNNNMSATPVHFDTRFEMGYPRSSLSWPGLDPNVDLLGHDLMSQAGSDASMTPPSTSRSATSSPPRGILSPEQRELKRQRDQARRDSKTSVRARRALSGASYSSASPPMTMAEFSTASPMPIYTTSPSQISLLTEPVTTIPGSSYIPAYSTSPLPEPSTMFTSPFPTLPSSGYMGLDYSSNYSQPPPALMGSGRPASLSEPGMLYAMPPVLPSGGGSNQESGHVRVVQSRPKPQCWDHGCNGRQFSTFSNLLRHQREKSGQAAKASCPNCGAEFTRTTARNGHLLHDKCKSRRSS